METIALESTDMKTYVRSVKRERTVITYEGKPVALLVGIEGIDEEALEWEFNDDFWRLIAERRGQESITRAELEERLSQK